MNHQEQTNKSKFVLHDNFYFTSNIMKIGCNMDIWEVLLEIHVIHHVSNTKLYYIRKTCPCNGNPLVPHF